MSVAQVSVKETAARVGITDAPEGLTAIHRRGYPAVIWHREPAVRFRTWINDLDPALLPSTRVTLRPDAVREAVDHLCSIAGTPQCEERAYLAGDIAALAFIFADVMQTEYLQLRLDIVKTDFYREFHIDAVTARLVCTYRGPGTQYCLSCDGSTPANVLAVPTCAPIVLRGTHWPVSPPCDFLHRSPPIEGTGKTRLVLALDPVEDRDSAHHNLLH